MPLNRTTTRALAASVALVAAGGTVAGAAVFHIPVLGFGASNAGAAATQFVQASAVRTSATKALPRRVVKTRYVDQIVHHHSAWSGSAGVTTAAGVSAPAPAAAPATAAPRHADEAPPTTPPTMDPTPPPTEEPPTSEPPDDGGHDSHEGHGGHGGGDDNPATTTTTTQVAQ